MKRTISLLCWLMLSFAACAAKSENVLQAFADELRRNTSQEPPPVALTAKFISHDGKQFLAFRLTNISKKPLHFYPSTLPWGSPGSLTFAAVVSDGIRLKNSYPIYDPAPKDKVTVDPGEFREGMYPLAWGLDIDAAPLGKDIILMWAYRVSVDFDSPFPVCSGIVVIPKRR